jgi:hypothetical protein
MTCATPQHSLVPGSGIPGRKATLLARKATLLARKVTFSGGKVTVFPRKATLLTKYPQDRVTPVNTPHLEA